MLNSKQSSALPSDTKRNIREHANVVTLRSKKELNRLGTQEKNDEEEKVAKEEQFKGNKPIEDKVVLGRIRFLDNPSPYVSPNPYL